VARVLQADNADQVAAALGLLVHSAVTDAGLAEFTDPAETDHHARAAGGKIRG